MAKRSGPNLSVIGSQPERKGPPSPSDLGPPGAALWGEIVSRYEFDDPASLQVLHEACAALDLATRCRAEIDRDGLVVRAKGLVKDHPLVKHEISARSFCCRSLARLGLDLEPVRAGAGRPSGGVGWSGREG